MTRPQASAKGPVLVARIRALFRSDCEGGALVELGVSLPIVFLIMTGIFAFSIALYQKLALAEGVSAGARILAADRGQHDPCADTAAAIIAAAPSLNTTTMKLTIVVNSVKEQTNVSASSATCPGSGTTSPNADMVSGASATVTATYACSIKAYNFSFPGCSLGSSVTEEIQ